MSFCTTKTDSRQIAGSRQTAGRQQADSRQTAGRQQADSRPGGIVVIHIRLKWKAETEKWREACRIL
jgi:hypothetical protein